MALDLMFDVEEEETPKNPANTLRISEIQPRKNQPRKEFDQAAR